jgi:hypothetical protein
MTKDKLKYTALDDIHELAGEKRKRKDSSGIEAFTRNFFLKRRKGFRKKTPSLAKN